MTAGEPRWQRHFLALLPDPAARAALAAVRLPESARRVHVDDLHLTLAFLGTLTEERESAACAAATAALRAGQPPRIRLDRVEYWPAARVHCATRSGTREPLAALAATLAAELAARGFPAETRPFRTHVTLARQRQRIVAPPKALRPPIGWRADCIALVASRPGVLAGPRYYVLQRMPWVDPPAHAGFFSPHHH